MFEILTIALVCAILPMLAIVVYRQGRQNGFMGDVKTKLSFMSKKLNAYSRRLAKIERKIGGIK